MFRPEVLIVFGCLCAIACDRTPPSLQTASTANEPGSPAHGARVIAQSSAPKDLPGPLTKADGTPLFERFVGVSCAISRAGDTWCYNGANKVFEKKFPGKRVRQVEETESPLLCILGEDGRVYLAGEFESDIDPALSLDFSVPKPVDGLSDIVSMHRTWNGFVFLDKVGRVWRWHVKEERNEDVLAVQMKWSEPQIILQGPFTALFGRKHVCVQGAAEFWCFGANSERPAEERYVPHSLPTGRVVLAVVGSAPCFAYAKDVHCYENWSPPRPGPVRPRAHYALPISVAKMSNAGGKMALDRNGILQSWDGFGSSQAEAEVPAPEVRALTHLGRLIDFDDLMGCVITDSGELKCDAPGGSLLRDVPVPAKFKLKD